MNKKIKIYLLSASVLIGVASTQPYSFTYAQEVEAQEKTLLEEEVREAVPAKQIMLSSGVAKIWIGDSLTEMECELQTIEGRTYLPFEFVKEVVEIIKEDEANIKVPSIIKEGKTLVSLSFLVDQFDFTLEYHPKEKTIVLKKAGIEETIIPGASFVFTKESYIAGEVVRAVDLSSDEDGYVVKRVWMVNGDEDQSASQLDYIFSKPVPGNYTISLKVQDDKGAWSEWETKEIEILPNQAPSITQFETVKKKYAQGEPIVFNYLFENEEWEEIVEAKWTYRAPEDALNNVILGKPHAIYAEGDFIVSLEIKDAYGNWSPKQETKIKVTDKVIQTEFEYIFNQGQIGSTITNLSGFNFRAYNEVVAAFQGEEKGMLILSNSPEALQQKGLLYEQIATGKGRLMFHHINQFSEWENQLKSKRLVVLVTNQGEEKVEMSIQRKAVRGPSTDVVFTGHQMLYDYLNTNSQTNITVQPGSSTLIYDTLGRNWKTGEAISGMFDFDVSEEVTFSVAVLDEGDELKEVSSMQRPIKDVHPRGTFGVLDQYYKVDLTKTDEEVALILGRSETNEWLVGVDALTGEIVQNRGNYGMFHHITVTAKEDTAVILNPRGNMFKGAIQWVGEPAYIVPTLGYFPSSNRATYIGHLKAGETKELLYMLPNASSAPVLLGFIPESKWEE